jgi:hypothetical protein
MKATSLLHHQHCRIETLLARVGREAAANTTASREAAASTTASREAADGAVGPDAATDATVSRERQQRLSLVLQLVEEMLTHLSLEDHVFLCRVADATGLRADAYREDQALVRNAVLQAVFAEEDDVLFEARVIELSLAFERHVRVLERDVFPLADAQLKGEDLETMGSRMQTCWDAAIHGHGPLPRVPRTHEHAAE